MCACSSPLYSTPPAFSIPGVIEGRTTVDTHDSVASIVRPDEADQSTDSTHHKLHSHTYYNTVCIV